ncbi:hypothetical protein Bhyg_03590, partial [Pseudolycoriella hygida]
MSILCERPDAEFFPTIPDLHDAVHSFAANEVTSKLALLGDLFARHGVTQNFGLSMVHRHFDISKEEVLVETLNDLNSVSVTSPWIIKDESLGEPDTETLWKMHETKMKDYVVPQTWSYDKSGHLKSFEYLATDSPMQAPPQTFVSELYAELKKLGLEENLGIRRIEHVRGQPTWETTPDGTRSNVVVFGAIPEELKKENYVTVLWYFDDDGSLHQEFFIE